MSSGTMCFLRIEGQVTGRVHKVVAHHLANLALAVQHHGVDSGVLNLPGGLQVDEIALLHQDFAGLGIHDVLRRLLVVNAGGDGQLLIILIAAHAHQVIALGVEEQRVEQIGGALQAGGLPGLLPLVDLDQALFPGLRVVALLNGGVQARVVPHGFHDLRVRPQAQGPQDHGDGKLPGPVDPDPQHVVAVRLVFQPGAPVRDNLGGIERLAGLVQGHVEIDAGRADQLADDDALRAVNNEGSMLGHQGEVAHKNVGFLDFTGFTVFQAYKNLQRSRVGQIPLAAARHGILRLIQAVVHKLQNEIPIIVSNGRNVAQDLAEIGIEKALIGVLLNLDQIRHLQHFVNA